VKTAAQWIDEGLAALELSRSADTLGELKGDNERAEAAFRRAVAVDPSNPAALFWLGDTLERLDRFAEAAEVLRTARACGATEPRLPVILARALQQAGRLDDALQEWESLLRARPGDADATCGKASCLRALGRDLETIAAWEAVMALPEDNRLGHFDRRRAGFYRAEAMARLGMHAEAAAAFRSALGSGQLWSAVDAVDFPALLRDFEPARIAFTEHLKALPPSATTWKLAGEKWSRAGRIAEALEAYEQALTLEPKNGDILWGKAEVLAKSGRLEEAIGLMRSALTLNPVAVLGIKARLEVMEKQRAGRAT
jgi:tetratricopeptide (TPR) repeat protein